MKVIINRFDPTIGFVPIPKEADVFIWNTPSGAIVIINEEQLSDKLPRGKWEILFRDSEKTFSKMKSILDYGVTADGWAFRDYTVNGEYPSYKFVSKHGHNLSYASLLRAHPIQLTEHQDLLILKKVEK